MLSKESYAGHEFQGRMAGFTPPNLEIPSKRIRGGRLPPGKILGFPELSISKKFDVFHVTLNNFLLPNRGVIFLISPGIEIVRSENLELRHGISRILLVFGEIIVYLYKMIKDLKNIKCGKSSHSGN